MTRFDRLAAAAWFGAAGLSLIDASGLLPLQALDRVELCPFHALTGLPCPGCGMTRAVVAAFQGRWGDCARLHPLALPLLAVWTAWMAWGAFNAARGRPFSAGFPDLARGRRGWALVALVLSVYALRLTGLA